MTIKDVCRRYRTTPDTLRYYERVGAIPAVHRTGGGARDYTAQDLAWVENAICMRSAGVPIETLIEYVKLYQLGRETFAARRGLLLDAREGVLKQLRQCQQELERLEYKISRYDRALETGELVWDGKPAFDPQSGGVSPKLEKGVDSGGASE